jgi:hypothetical protein
MGLHMRMILEQLRSIPDVSVRVLFDLNHPQLETAPALILISQDCPSILYNPLQVELEEQRISPAFVVRCFYFKSLVSP